MEKEALEEMVKKSRSFLHDISNQILIAHGMESFVLMKLKKGDQIDETMFKKLEKSIAALDKIMELMKQHKEYIISVKD